MNGITKNLKDLLNSKNISLRSYAEFLGVSEKTIQNKINGNSDFLYSEVEKTKQLLFPEYELAYLFKRFSEKETTRKSA